MLYHMSEFPSFLRLISHHFHLLAIMNKASMYMGVKYLFESLLLILLGIYLEVKLLDMIDIFIE